MVILGWFTILYRTWQRNDSRAGTGTSTWRKQASWPNWSLKARQDRVLGTEGMGFEHGSPLLHTPFIHCVTSKVYNLIFHVCPSLLSPEKISGIHTASPELTWSHCIAFAMPLFLQWSSAKIWDHMPAGCPAVHRLAENAKWAWGCFALGRCITFLLWTILCWLLVRYCTRRAQRVGWCMENKHASGKRSA